MEQKTLRDILVLSGSLILVLSLLFIFNPEKRLWLSQKASEKINLTKGIPTPAKECAKDGEKPVSNFDIRTGKTDESIQVVNCCEGLKAIPNKQPNGIHKDKSGTLVCAKSFGGYDVICSPCGNGICDTAYEDVCNCREDCK